MLRLAHGLALGLALVAAGCSTGPRHMRVWGTVTYQGEKVTQGRIEFVPADGTDGPTTGGVITDGSYDVPREVGPRAGGVYRVELRASRNTGKTEPDPKNPGARIPVYAPLFPPQYNTGSVLKVTVADDADKNRFDFHLPEKAR